MCVGRASSATYRDFLFLISDAPLANLSPPPRCSEIDRELQIRPSRQIMSPTDALIGPSMQIHKPNFGLSALT